MRDRPAARMLRAALSGAFFLLYGLFAIAFAPLLFLATRRMGRRLIRLFYKGFVLLARLSGLYSIEETGSRPVRADGGARIVIANHVSLVDICILLPVLKDAVCIAKPAAARNPFLGIVVRRLFIASGTGEEILAAAENHLASGTDVVVFPQGTRGGKKLHRGAARLSLRTGTPMEAWRISYDPVVLAKGQPWWDVGAKTIKIRLRYSGTIAPEEPDSRSGAINLTRLAGNAIGVASEGTKAPGETRGDGR